MFSSIDADDDNVFDVDYLPNSEESCSSEISIENSIKQFLPLSDTRATDHSVPYSSGGNIVVSGEHNGSDDMNASNSTDCQQNTEGDSQSSLTTSVDPHEAGENESSDEDGVCNKLATGECILHSAEVLQLGIAVPDRFSQSQHS